MNIIRRSFLKLGTALAGSLVLSKYIEVPFDWDASYKDWIEDRGDFIVVRIPAFNTLSKVTFDKPTIFLLDEQAMASDIVVNNVANISIPNGGGFYDSRFDASQSLVEGRKESIIIGRNTKNVVLSGLHVVAMPTPGSISMRMSTGKYIVPQPLRFS